jgi:hypothetical protein
VVEEANRAIGEFGSSVWTTASEGFSGFVSIELSATKANWDAWVELAENPFGGGIGLLNLEIAGKLCSVAESLGMKMRNRLRSLRCSADIRTRLKM